MSKMSKASPRLVLNTLAAGAVAATMAGLSGCSPQPEEPKVQAGAYQSVAQCVADGNASNLCSEAQSVAAKQAPEVTYASANDCDQDWKDGCHTVEQPAVQAAAAPVTGGGGGGSHYVYVPNTWGYMYGSSGPASARPVYHGSDGYLHTGNGVAVSPGRSAVPASAFAKGAGASHFASGSSHTSVARAGGSVARGGFGGAGRGASVGG